MRKLGQRVLVPALAAVSLTLTACSSPGTSHAGAVGDVPKEQPPLIGSPKWHLGPGPTEPARRGAVAVPTDGAAADRDPKADRDLKVYSFDPRTGRAVISSKASAEPAPGRPVRTGDVIASPPTRDAPRGILAEVTGILGRTAHGTEVRTAPTTLAAVLGDARVAGTVPVDPSEVEVSPLVPGVKVSRSGRGDVRDGPESARLPPGSLRVDVDTTIPTGTAATGFVRLAPQVEFSYDGGGPGGGPKAASLALAGDWATGWKLKGRGASATHGKPLRVPFARLRADPVLHVGGIPVVVNLDLTCYVLIDADGKARFAIEQGATKGDFRIGGTYRADTGWAPEAKAGSGTSRVRAAVDGASGVRAALGTEASVGLYGNPGLTGDLAAPYVRTEASGGAAWKLSGGVELQGALLPQLKVFGAPAPGTRQALPRFRREWKIDRGKGAIRVPRPPRDAQKPPPDGTLDPKDRIPGLPGTG
ncbi:hypothetical protein I5Q34_24600 [Streptomyces sp. AV19]|uniref:hypothetical protein n=1 Tax=Streptomyces sp. AV19 TaxID=2793068 RepID=UPI0018FEBE05|nr:hypothetical protein [Streptomyces sp. AV19]MBH1937409.1 hypothetical protein [Streptomyces sp. AV19]MDG4533818.1 hypothetical protein [Streptomyces sp. AV19]